MTVKRDSKIGIRNEWQHLDSAENVADFVAYLERVEPSPHLQLYRESIFRGLQVNDGDCLLDNFEEIWPIMNFERSMRQAAAELDFSPDEVKNWEKEIQAASKTGCFRIQFAGGICVGRKPEV